MNTKKEYIAPKLTAVSIKVERGYADSWLGLSNPFEPLPGDFDNANNEVWGWSESGSTSNPFGGDDWTDGWDG